MMTAATTTRTRDDGGCYSSGRESYTVYTTVEVVLVVKLRSFF